MYFSEDLYFDGPLKLVTALSHCTGAQSVLPPSTIEILISRFPYEVKGKLTPIVRCSLSKEPSSGPEFMSHRVASRPRLEDPEVTWPTTSRC